MTSAIVTNSLDSAKQARARLDAALGLPAVGTNAASGQPGLAGWTVTACNIVEAYDWPNAGVTSYVMPIRADDAAAASSAGLAVVDVDLTAISRCTVYNLAETTLVAPVPTLSDAQQARFAAIDRRTDAIIAAGYEWPAGSGVRYSTSIESQTRLIGLMIAAATLPAGEWPIAWNSLDDTHCASLSGPADVQSMYATGLEYIKAAVLSGTTVKNQVRAAATVDAVNAVVDPR